MVQQIADLVRLNFAILVVAVAYVASCISILTHKGEKNPEAVVTLSLAHWQLEPGVREGIEQVARDYCAMHPYVRITQTPVPESVYGQWITTQMIGGTAPDIVQCGSSLPPATWRLYFGKYFIPLTGLTTESNPYNKGTDLEQIPLRMTYKDGMRSAYVDDLMEFMTIPMAQHAVRVFYNRDLLRKLTGREDAPESYRDFLELCEKISVQKTDKGIPYVPIAGSGYHFGMWESAIANPLTYDVLRRADLNRDGRANKEELFASIRAGLLDMSYPPVQAKFRVIHQLTKYFQPGFSGLTRDDGVLLFAQQRSVFISAGTWDASSLVEQAKGKFEIGVIDFPFPSKDDPEFGPVVHGKRYDQPREGFLLGVTSRCRNPELAFDFLLYMASRQVNEKFNSHVGWIPAIKGARTTGLLQQFEPNLEGVYSQFDNSNINIGGETFIRWQQLYSLYQVNQIDFDQLRSEFEPFYKRRGERDFLSGQREAYRNIRRNEATLAAVRARALLSGTSAMRQTEWQRYRALLAGRQLNAELWLSRIKAIVDGTTPLSTIPPYEYTPDAMAAIRRAGSEKP